MLNKIANRIVKFFTPEKENIEKSDYSTVVKTGFLEIIEADIKSTKELIKAVDVSLDDQYRELEEAIAVNNEALNKSEDDEDLISNMLYLKQQKDELFDKGLIVKSGLFNKLNDLQKAFQDIDNKDLDINEHDEGKYVINLDSNPDFKTLVKSEEGKTFQEYLEVISEVLANPKKIYEDDIALEPEPTPEPVELEYKKYMHHSLGRDRESMPQISKKDIDEAVIHFAQKSPNTKVKKKSISLYKLKPTQSELNDEKVIGMTERDDIDISKEIFIVSKDNYLVDSHHRWATLLEKYKDSEEDPMVTVYKINLDTAELLRRFNLLKISGKKDIDGNIKKSEELEKSLYIKREGGPGNYKYTYPSDSKGGSSSKEEEGVKEKDSITPEERAKNFKAWFVESKVVDEKGAPLTVYHGTPNDFKEFKIEEKEKKHIALNSSYIEKGAFFTSDKSTAKKYSVNMKEMSEWGVKQKEHEDKLATEGKDDEYFDEVLKYQAEDYYKKGKVLETHLKIEKPLVLDAEGKDWSKIIPKIYEEDLSKYDGVIVKNVKELDSIQDTFIVFNPNQIKSADDNEGTFDPNSNDITKSETVTIDGKQYTGDWKTVKGNKVFISGGKMVIGPKPLQEGKPKETTRKELFGLDEAKNVDEVSKNVRRILKEYSHRKMAATQVESYLNEIGDLGKKYIQSIGVSDRETFQKFLDKEQSKMREGKGKERSEAKKERTQEKTAKNVDNIEKLALEMEAEMQDMINADDTAPPQLSNDESKYLDYTNGKKKISRDAIGKLQAKVQETVQKKAETLNNDNLSSAHIDALTTYVSEKYKDINKHMRGLEKTKDEGLLKTIDHINEAISQNTLKEDLIVYRSVSDKSHLESDQAFQSVSLDPAVAFNFSRSEDSRVYAIRIPAGTNYAYLGGSEKELVLNNKVDLSKQVINN